MVAYLMVVGCRSLYLLQMPRIGTRERLQILLLAKDSENWNKERVAYLMFAGCRYLYLLYIRRTRRGSNCRSYGCASLYLLWILRTRRGCGCESIYFLWMLITIADLIVALLNVKDMNNEGVVADLIVAYPSTLCE